MRNFPFSRMNIVFHTLRGCGDLSNIKLMYFLNKLHLRSFRLRGAFLGDVPLEAAVIAGLVPGGRGAVSRDMTGLATIEAPAEAISVLLDLIALLPLEAGVGASAGNVAFLTAVVAFLRRVAAPTSAAAAAAHTNGLVGLRIPLVRHG